MTVSEDGSGITVTTIANKNGTPQKSTVGAKNAADLKQTYPDAYRTRVLRRAEMGSGMESTKPEVEREKYFGE